MTAPATARFTSGWLRHDLSGIAACLGQLEEQISRSLAENIEDDLYRFHVRELNCLEGLFDFLNADPIMADLANLDKVIQNPEDLRAIINIGWRTVQLHQVEGLNI